MIVQARAAHAGVLERKSERLDEVQLRPRVGAQADHIAGIRRNFGLDEDDVEHGAMAGKSAPSLPRQGVAVIP
ncbi:hypothetical protein D3C85_1623640 [compost metagenome]